MSELKSIVWKILKGPPIDVIDDDIENQPVHLNGVLELVHPRSDGDHAGSREIGSANIITAYNLVHMKKIKNAAYDNTSTIDIYKQIIDSLISERLIRRKPAVIRETFKVIHNG